MSCYFLFRLLAIYMNGYSVRGTRFRRLVSPLLLAIAVFVVLAGDRLTTKNHSQRIAFIPLKLDAANPALARVGALQFLGAWELKSDNGIFGGLSALVGLKNGRFLAISDAGAMVGFGLSGNGRADKPFIAALPGAYGSGIKFRDRDSEGLAYDPGTGTVWVSYEFRHAIRRFPPSLSRVNGIIRPAAMRDWPDNSGTEALVRLNDGRFLAFAEGGGEGDGIYPALHFSGDPVERGTSIFPFRYRPPEGYRITDATLLPDGRLLLLHRRIGLPDGFTAKLSLFDPSAIRRGALVEGKVIATLAPPLLVDNMEGIATTQEQGRTIVWLVSDDNFNIFQRTLLMKFELDLPEMKKPTADAPGFDSL
jgi:hypothetical protein